jgi:hypothetical protein
MSGVRAMTTRSSARVPFVHQSFSPFSVQKRPSALGVAVVRRFAGSEPASASVSAKAEMAPLARRGKKRCFCSSVPNSVSGCGILARHHRHGARIARVRETEPAVFGGNLDAERANVSQLLHVRLGDLARAVDHVGITALEKVAQLRHEWRGARGLRRIAPYRMRMNKIETEAAQKELANEARA